MYTQEKLYETYGDLYNEQLFVESRFKKEAEEKLKFSLEKERSEGQAGTQPIGQHFIRFVYDTVRTNMEQFFTDKLAPKKGVKASYVGIMLELADAFKEAEDELYDLCTYSTISTMMSMVVQERIKAVQATVLLIKILPSIVLDILIMKANGVTIME